MPFPCRAHAVPLPCPAAKGLERVFPIRFTQCGRVWFTHAMPRPCHPRPCRSSQGHGTVWPSREGLWANCRFRLLPAITRSSTKFSSDAYQSQMQVASAKSNTICMDKEKSSSSTLQKKTICYTVGLAVRIFPATMRRLTKDTALSEQGKGAALHVWINARHSRGTAWARHAMCESAFSLYHLSATLRTLWCENFKEKEKWIWHSVDRVSWYIGVIWTNYMQFSLLIYFDNLKWYVQ